MSAQVAEPLNSSQNTESWLARFAEWVDYRLNPMLVKDVRGWLRSRGFLLLFFAGMLVAQIATVLFVISSTNDSGGVGRFMFMAITCGLSVVCGSIVPYMTYHKMMGELKSKASELAMASYITPSVMINGKLQSSLAASLLFFTAAAPSLAIAYLLGGVDILTAVIVVAMIFLGNFSSTLFMMFLAGFGSPTLGRILSLAIFFCALFGNPGAIVRFMEETSRSNVLYQSEFWIATMFNTISSIPLLYFFHSLAVAYLSPVHFNRDTKPRAVLSLTAAVSFVSFLLLGYFVDGITSMNKLYQFFGVYSIRAAFVFGIALFFILGTPAYPSRRVCSNWPKGNLWPTFMYPGVDRLNAYILLHFIFFFIIGLFYLGSGRDESVKICLAIGDIFSFFVIGSLTYNIIGGWCERKGINISMIHTVLGANIAWLILILTIYISMSVLPNTREQYALYFSPVTNLSYLLQGRRPDGLAYVLPVCMGVLGLVMYFVSFCKAWADGLNQRRFTKKLRWVRGPHRWGSGKTSEDVEINTVENTGLSSSFAPVEKKEAAVAESSDEYWVDDDPSDKTSGVDE